MAQARTDEIAREVDAALTSGRQVAPVSERVSGFDLPAAYAVTAALRSLRVGRGETHVGRKIGFSNRVIWAEYGVFAPIWGDMYASTVHDLKDGANTFALESMAEPRIEPEIAFGLAAAPRAGMDEAALIGCIGWVSHGYEIVQSIFPGWRFAASDVVAGGGVHGALLLGPRLAVTSGNRADWLARLSDFEVELARNGEPIDRGHARNVLDGPLSALRHLVELLAADPHNPSLAEGEIITTGTVTRAFPIAAGERWTTRVFGLPVPALDVTFS
jgi:2-oxo-3-hexenedioate decarboxylase